MKHTPKWNKNPVSTTKECNILLSNGYTLQNSTGGKVSLTETGKQKVIQTHKSQRNNKKRHYNFRNPQYWFVVGESDTGYKIPITLKMRFWYWWSEKVL